MDSIQVMGNILTARWELNGKATEGSYCTTQSESVQVCDGSTWFTIAMAVMTFLEIMFPGKLSRSQARRLAATMIILIFLFLPWCWISETSRESRLRIGSEYPYFWLAAIVAFVLYGTIVVNWFREATAERDSRRHREAISMGWKELQRQRILRTGPVNVLLWLLTGRRFGFSDPKVEDQEDHNRWGPCLLLRWRWVVALFPAELP
ncbi:hypothetical protein BS47DRAFT_1339243 [Hydnum rufescens UP504]|uniref:Uncharacterized protein n=1 Tax=Hydnum rufescens UP504 TaxID=1448309 RepID=A0A9P6B4S8_9AGAM|nr:hypothetical protein BS47DRAFT_1339243 [Hydnum rufescens UP504]